MHNTEASAHIDMDLINGTLPFLILKINCFRCQPQRGTKVATLCY